MTLQDAFNGLLQYLSTHPDGGTREELIKIAVAAGFVEPLLNNWLDTFLVGCVDADYIAAANYNTHFAPRVAAAGFTKAKTALTYIFRGLTVSGEDLDRVSKQDQINNLTDLIQALNVRLVDLETVRTAILNTFPLSDPRTGAVAAIDDVVIRLTRMRTVYQTARSTLQQELAG